MIGRVLVRPALLLGERVPEVRRSRSASCGGHRHHGPNARPARGRTGGPAIVGATVACRGDARRRLRRRGSLAGRRDRRRAAARAVLRRLDDRLGEHDRDRARRASRSATGSAAGWPTATRPARASAASCSSPPALLALVPFVAGPFLHVVGRRARPRRGRRVRRLAARRARARRGAGAAARRCRALRGAAQRARASTRRAGSPGACTRSRRSARWSGTFLAALRADPARRARGARSWSSRSRWRVVAALGPAPALASLGAASAVARADRAPGRHGQGRRPTATRDLREPRPSTSTRASSSARRRAAARAQRGPGACTRSTGRATWLTGDYWDELLVAAVRRRRAAAPRSIAILGNAAGTTARAYGHFFPATRVDGVEIDPAADRGRPPAASTCAGPHLHIHTADARPFLRARTRRYDVDLRRRLPPALHPVLPDDARVLRAGPRPPDARRRGARQRRPSRATPTRLEQVLSATMGDGLRARRARPDRADEHAAGRRAPAPCRAARLRAAARALPPRPARRRGGRRARLAPRAARRRRLHRRPRAGRVAHRRVDRSRGRDGER